MIDKESFLCSETRCDYFISSEMKKIWKIQMEMLQIVSEICNRHHFRYSLYAGSMLGVARHQGYIPWDDDLDIAMPRNDYDKFLQIVQQELPPYLFAQNAITSPEWPLGFTKIRNTQTAAIEKFKLKHHCTANQGLFIDIFPLDAIYSDPIKREAVYQKYKQRFHFLRLSHKIRWSTFDWETRHDTPLSAALHYCNVVWANIKNCFWHVIYAVLVWAQGGYLENLKKLDDIFRSLPQAECDAICDCTFCALQNPKAKVYKKEWYDTDDYIDMPFEYMTVKIPARYDEILTQKFGDWHKMVRANGFHEIVEYSTERSYKDILIEKYGYKVSDFK